LRTEIAASFEPGEGASDFEAGSEQKLNRSQVIGFLVPRLDRANNFQPLLTIAADPLTGVRRRYVDCSALTASMHPAAVIPRVADHLCPDCTAATIETVVPNSSPETGRDDQILRFRESERHLHWAIALPFMVSYATALILIVVYNPNPARPLRWLFSSIHRISGMWLTVLPLWAVVTHRGDVRVYLENVREAFRWTLDDLKWLMLSGPAALSSRVTLPPQGKFNAAEKINFMTVMATYPLYIVTGVLIWLPGVPLAAWLLHFSMAVMATPLLLGHVFMATVNPETRAGLSGMFSGFVSREWAKHHYRRWYEQQHGV
jgi:formate dehydrogenase subunit gamma